MAIPKTILICGATGTQGSSTVKALLASPRLPSDAKILALTRSPSSPKAQALAALDPRVQLLAGEPTVPEAIFAAAPAHIDAVYNVTVHGPPGYEESQTQPLFDACVAHNVSHFVFASADRGGEVLSETNPSPAPHIAAKFRIEKYIKANAQGTNTAWTFLRPVTFFENMSNDFNGKSFAAMWHNVGKKPVQMVATSDIGFFVATVILAPDEWAGKALGIAGDELNYDQGRKIFKETMGFEMPHALNIMGTLAKKFMGDIGAMFQWFEKEGFNVDIEKARRINPNLQTFAQWLVNDSQFEKVEKVEKLEKTNSATKQCTCGHSWCSKCKHQAEAVGA
ncbi:NAD(P)-binding protein [Mollisia scopiformis]|uniref:NAD(P)-binding protein n=1 Tax=Mollisia scopiformis TaxID=149040 RepID=A0A194X2L4_MOLSC|nr:NAD(P)-binding protein [Mollisia scopiformis]KUJ14426.1 NAD(P)-binding protein [Mollisia scopiformis]